MKIMIIDPDIDGKLEIYNNLDERCGVISYNINMCYNINDIPTTIEMQFEAYVNILGKDIRGR
jgi:hypothetical protein